MFLVSLLVNGRLLAVQVWGESKVISGFLTAQPHAVQKSTVYLLSTHCLQSPGPSIGDTKMIKIQKIYSI